MIASEIEDFQIVDYLIGRYNPYLNWVRQRGIKPFGNINFWFQDYIDKVSEKNVLNHAFRCLMRELIVR